jgi:HlyD family secretion protein
MQTTMLTRTLPSETAEPQADHRGFAWVGYLAIAVSFGGFGIWAAMAPLDSAAIAQAKIAVESDRKPVQHLEGGMVREILVKNIEQVREGQVLFRLQPTKAQASADTLMKQIDAALAVRSRLEAEITGRAMLSFPPELLERQHIAETQLAMMGQRQQFAERRATLDGQIGILKTKIEQTSRDVIGRKARLASLKAQNENLDAELDKLRPLMSRGLTTNARLLPLERERIRNEGEIGQTVAELARLEQTIAEARQNIDLSLQKFRAEAVQQIGDVRQRLAELKDKVTVAKDVLQRIEVRAPRAGIVQNIKVKAIGEVVRPGETLAEVVPVGDNLVLSAKVSPIDIDSIVAGLRAEVKFPGLSRRDTPIISGRVENVSADSLIDEATRQPYYAAKVLIDADSLPPAIARKLVPGMPATVLISRGERTMLDYLISPLRDAIFKTMREK